MYQGVVHTSLRLRSRICNNFLAKGCFFEPGTSHVRNNLLRNTDAFGRESEVIWFHESEPKYTPVPGRGYAPAKIFGGGLNWCPSTTEKVLISLRPGLGLRSPIVERNNYMGEGKIMSPLTRLHQYCVAGPNNLNFHLQNVESKVNQHPIDKY